MTSSFYISRTLYDAYRTYDELEILEKFQIIIVLAEPGAGKSSLLNNLARALNVKSVPAKLFLYKNNIESNKPLVIDALDELVRIDQSGIEKLLGKISDLSPTKLIISSRSSEWEDSYTKSFNEHLGLNASVIRLSAFTEGEQQKIFEAYKPNENFENFKFQVSNFDLESLLPNPQFLQLLAEAYIESNRKFSNRKSIFQLAIESLAREVNCNFNMRNDLALHKKVELSEEIFAKLLLSGAEGVSTDNQHNNRLFPRLDTLFSSPIQEQLTSLISSKLFRMGYIDGQHLPIHKIVAEYCAANYLIKRIVSERNSLILSQCLAIIAPNNIVRDELRGLIGWMAALGNKTIQEHLIDLDPYAILANGDPSQLETSSKQRLLEKLCALAEEDPFFRRNDFWRNFNIPNLFDSSSTQFIQSILNITDNKNHLRGLILELLVNSILLPHIASSLEQIVLSKHTTYYIRDLAAERLTEIKEYNFKNILEILLHENSNDSLSLIGNIIPNAKPDQCNQQFIADYLINCAKLYPTARQKYNSRVIGERYFIKKFIYTLNLELTEWLLNFLVPYLKCICHKEFYECECRNGLSKIIGSLLDRYFELETKPYDPEKIWKWIENLNFQSSKSSKDSLAVRVLQQDTILRKAIIENAFRDLSDDLKIHQMNWEIFQSHTHSGLELTLVDTYYILDMAFKLDNIGLWNCFMPSHQFYLKKPDQPHWNLRKYAKYQASKKNIFLKAWVSKNNASKIQFNKNKLKLKPRRLKYGKNKLENIRKANIKYIQDNRILIESGQHLNCLRIFSDLLLNRPEEIMHDFGDQSLVKNALKNCLSFIESKIPSLADLSEQHCQSIWLPEENILYAACIEIFRENGSLEKVQPALLEKLRTIINIKHHGIPDEEHILFKTEINRILFTDNQSILEFVKAYLEPQLANKGCQRTDVRWLGDDPTFNSLLKTIPLEWLMKYPAMHLEAASHLFNLASQFNNRQQLNCFIEEHCKRIKNQLSETTGTVETLDKHALFWLMRGFFYCSDSIAEEYWQILKLDPENIFALNEKVRGWRSNHSDYWPALTPKKIWLILDSYIKIWPKVDLPSRWGKDDHTQENAYRFLTNIIFSLEKIISTDSLAVVNQLLEDHRFIEMHTDLRSIRAMLTRQVGLLNYEAPHPQAIVNFLDTNELASVEGLRALILEELSVYQKDLKGGDTTTPYIFYNKQVSDNSQIRLGEVEATQLVAERLKLKLESKGINITLEHQMANQNRCDITCAKTLDNRRRLLVIESKGQWHKDLYNAASTQLQDRYAIHPDAEQQGIYLVLWFGKDEKVANKKNRFSSACELKHSIEQDLDDKLKGLIDIFVLDVSLDQYG